jgi:hypothetical protein
MKGSEIYVDLDGNELSLSFLDAEERRLVARLCEYAGENPEYADFDSRAYDVVGAFYDARGRSRKQSIQTIPYRICLDLAGRLGIAQGLIRPEDPRNDLELLIEKHFPSVEAFAQASGIEAEVLKEFLVGEQDLSLDTLSSALQRVGCRVRIVFTEPTPNPRPARKAARKRARKAAKRDKTPPIRLSLVRPTADEPDGN